MMKLLPVAALALLSASAVFADAGQQIHFEKPDVSDVLVLTSENFDEKINSAELALVEFYAPWCGHCQKLAPHYESAATTLKKDDIVLAKVDCTVQEEVCGRFGVGGYPTLKVFRKGNHKDYAGERVDNAIVKYMQKQALPAVSELKGEDVKAFSTSERVVVIGFFSGPDSTDYTELSAVANKLRDDYLFGATFDADAAKRFNVTIPGLILFKKFDEIQNIFTDAFTEEAISSFVTTNAMPLMDDISPENYSKYVHPTAVPLAYLFVSTDSERAEFGPRVEAVAKELKGKMNFVFIDAIKYGAHAENVNLLPDSWPALGIEKFDTKQKFPFDQAKEITTEAIKEFAEKVLDGTAKEKIKSEPIPTENDGPVTILVGETFTNITQDPTKDVFVEFYATWCGHCKKLAPIYENLGKLYKDAEDIVIANIEATKNTHSGVDVTGFPTLKLFKARTNEVVDYEGNRSLESMTEFLTNNAASSFRPSASEIAKLSEPKPDTPSKEETPSEEHQKPEHQEHDEL